MRSRPFSFLVMMSALLDTAGAATIDRTPGTEPAVFFLEGDISPGDQKRFIQQILDVDNAVVVLNSPGGDVDAAIEIGKAIRLKGFGTVIPDPATCASACGLIWLSGQPRFLGPNAKVGFHAAYDIQNGAPRERGAANALVGAYLGSLGFSQRTILYLTSSPPEEMQWVTLADAPQLGIDVQKFEMPPDVPGQPDIDQKPVDTSPLPAPANPSASIPNFKDFPADPSPLRARAAVDLSTPEAHAYRTRLRKAASQEPNFAGHYVLTTWGCGTTCVTGAAVDLETGRVIFLPATVCCWGAVDSAFQPVEFRKFSKLVVLSGQLNEEGDMGAHFFFMGHRGFISISTLRTSDDFGASKREQH